MELKGTIKVSSNDTRVLPLEKLDLVLFSEYLQTISRIFPYHGQHTMELDKTGNWIFQPFSTIFTKYSHTMEEVPFSSA